MPVTKNREYRSMMPMGTAASEKRIDSDYYVEGYATTFDDPYVLYEIEGQKFYEVIAS